MSYCRWSTDSFRCDLYCYEDVAGGYTTHVAGNRLIRPLGAPDDAPWQLISQGRFSHWRAQHDAFSEWMSKAGGGKILLPFAGETFRDPDLASFRARLIELRDVGYCFPDSVLAEIDEEIAGESGSGVQT